MANSITTDMLAVGTYLTNTKQLKVPEYQRSYAWTDDEVVQLWDDLIESIDSKRTEYFIGPMVLKRPDNGPIELIDGQQRLTTILIIVSIFRKILRQTGDDHRANVLKHQYFGTEDLATLTLSEKFLMNEENGDVFRKFISTEVDQDAIRKEQQKFQKKQSNYLLLQAILTLREKITVWLGSSNELQKMISVLTYIEGQTKILALSVEDEADAYTIFETLNDRGRSLDTLDLLKNHLYSKSRLKLDEVRSNWQAVKENLSEVDSKNRFIDHFWLSVHGRTSKPGLFRTMRDAIPDTKRALEFSKSLAESSRTYAALYNSSSAVWDKYSATTRKNILALQILDVQQALPILLAAKEHFIPLEFQKLTTILVVMAVRYTFIGEERTGVISNYYADIPRKIRSGEMSKSSHISSHIKAIYPSDTSFLAAFGKKSITESKRARYILSEIENSQSSTEKVVNSDPEYVNLEHVMPKNTNQHWTESITGIPDDERKDYVNRIGNLVLMPKSANKLAGSKDFKSKQQIFASIKEFSTTKDLGNYTKWNKKAIETRQVKLAEQAVKAWKLDLKNTKSK